MPGNFIDKARENLKMAQIGFENHCFNASANRAYYAAFQGAVAALLDKGLTKEKLDHKWVQAEFSEKLIKRQKVYPSGMKSYLTEMQLIRNKADYEPRGVSQKTAFRQMTKAEEMIKRILKEIKK